VRPVPGKESRLHGRSLWPGVEPRGKIDAVAVSLYSTSTRGLTELAPPPSTVGIYVCGPTVYQRAHIGNARPFVVFSWLRNWLRERGYAVTLVQNITDINDKIYEAAPGHSAELAEQATAWYLEDTGDLGLGRPDVEPRATETVEGQVAFIQELIERDLAYAVDGDVYFRVTGFPDYGSLSGQRLDQVEEQEPNPLKRDPRDFALWKANKPGEDTWWDSPWGRGRPGWHIECSVMAEQALGPAFEIHGGGLDLVFPHHENEIAQSRGAGRPFARIWMHVGMLELAGEEMHKSLDNDVSLRAVLDGWGREAVLVYFLRGHWRKPIDYSDDVMYQAKVEAESFRNAFRTEATVAASSNPGWARLEAALDDDFNTPEALSVMHEWRRSGELELLARTLRIFGLESLTRSEEAPPELVALAERRRTAREDGDFETADRLRGEIEERGWLVRDLADGFRLVPRP
jgi:cysteinyl-tRNA synthetase